MKKFLHISLLLVSILALILSGCGGSSGGGNNNDTGNNDDVGNNDDGGTTTYTVAYNGNGNTGGNVPTDGTRYKQGEAVAVLGKNTLVKDQLVFAGWTKNADSNGTIYNQGDTFAMGMADVTLSCKMGFILR